MKYLLIAGCFLSCVTGNSQKNALYDGIPMGKYAVGFKIFTITDSLRVSKPLYNYFGEKETGDRHRKILIHLWYPAKPNTGGQAMDYATYATNAELRATNDVIPPDRKAIILNNSRENFQNFFGDMKDEDWNRVKETKFLSYKEAIPAAGKFPLLIGMLRHFSTTVTNEMLASNGYIVAMVDGAGLGYPIGYPIEIADMQQTINHLSRSFSFDQDNLGSFGFSGSGFTQVVFAMIDERVRALADLESGLYMEGLWQQLSASNFYNDQRLKIPFLHLFSKDLSREEKYLDEFEKKLKYSERYRVLMSQPGLHHWDFATEGRVSTTLVHLRGEKEPGIRACYELANLYLLHYFNAILKNDASSRAFLEKKQVIAGYADSSWSYFRYPALKAPPDKSQFAEFIDRKGIDSAVALARSIFRRDSSAEFLHENILNQLSYTYRRIQKIKEALALLRLATEFHPDKAWVWNNLASIEEDYGDKKEAVRCSQKVVDLLGNVMANEPSFDERVKKSAIERIERLKGPSNEAQNKQNNWRRITDNAATDFHALFSPDGKKILYDSDRSGHNEIYLFDLASGGTTQLTQSAATKDHARWFPDGKNIVFETEEFGEEEICKMNADGSNIVRLTDKPGVNGAAFVSPQGDRILFGSTRDNNWDIYVMNADGSNEKRLTNNPGDDIGHTWSPDGSKIAYMAKIGNNYEIYVMNADGSGPQRLTNQSSSDEGPEWSPDGSKLAFYSDKDGSVDLFIMNADGSGLKKLTNSPLPEYDIFWSLDGSRLFFITGYGEEGDICTIDVQGTKFQKLTDNKTRETSLARSPDGQSVAFISDKDGNLEIYILPLKN